MRVRDRFLAGFRARLRAVAMIVVERTTPPVAAEVSPAPEAESDLDRWLALVADGAPTLLDDTSLDGTAKGHGLDGPPEDVMFSNTATPSFSLLPATPVPDRDLLGPTPPADRAEASPPRLLSPVRRVLAGVMHPAVGAARRERAAVQQPATPPDLDIRTSDDTRPGCRSLHPLVTALAEVAGSPAPVGDQDDRSDARQPSRRVPSEMAANQSNAGRINIEPSPTRVDRTRFRRQAERRANPGGAETVAPSRAMAVARALDHQLASAAPLRNNGRPAGKTGARAVRGNVVPPAAASPDGRHTNVAPGIESVPQSIQLRQPARFVDHRAGAVAPIPPAEPPLWPTLPPSPLDSGSFDGTTLAATVPVAARSQRTFVARWTADQEAR